MKVNVFFDNSWYVNEDNINYLKQTNNSLV